MSTAEHRKMLAATIWNHAGGRAIRAGQPAAATKRALMEEVQKLDAAACELLQARLTPFTPRKQVLAELACYPGLENAALSAIGLRLEQCPLDANGTRSRLEPISDAERASVARPPAGEPS